MTTKAKINLTVLSYIVSLISVAFLIVYYIEDKDKSLRFQARCIFSEYFTKASSITKTTSDRRFFESHYISLRELQWDEVATEIPLELYGKDENNSELQSYVSPFAFKKHVHSTGYNAFQIKDNMFRWKIRFLEYSLYVPSGYKTYGGCVIYDLYPYQIKYNRSHIYNYYVNQDLEGTYNYVSQEYTKYSTKTESTFLKLLEISEACSNEYYVLSVYNPIVANDYWGDLRENSKSHDAGNVRNEEMEMSMRTSIPKYYYIKETGQKSIERRNLLIIGFLLCTIILILVIVPLKKKRNIELRTLYEPLKTKLLRLCKPAQFMSSYNKETISIANSIYSELQNTKYSDKEALISLRDKAILQLSLSWFSTDDIDYLKQLANPQRYMKPYNAQKVAEANDCYALLDNLSMSADEYEALKGRIIKLNTKVYSYMMPKIILVLVGMFSAFNANADILVNGAIKKYDARYLLNWIIIENAGVSIHTEDGETVFHWHIRYKKDYITLTPEMVSIILEDVGYTDEEITSMNMHKAAIALSYCHLYVNLEDDSIDSIRAWYKLNLSTGEAVINDCLTCSWPRDL